MKFTGTGEDWQRFLDAATINYDIKQIAIEAKEGKLFTSAQNEKKQNCWAMVVGRSFEIEEPGLVVLSTEELKTVCRLLHKTTEYTGSVEDNEFLIKEIDGKAKRRITMEDPDVHQTEGGTSWVPPHPKDEQRFFVSIRVVDGLPVPRCPPIPGQEIDDVPYEQIIRIPIDKLKEQINTAKIIGAELITLETSNDETSLSIFFKNGKLSHEDAIEVEGTIPYNWQQTYTDPLKDIINMANGSLFMAMTDRNSVMVRNSTGELVDTGENAGLWILTKDENFTATYFLSPYIPEGN